MRFLAKFFLTETLNFSLGSKNVHHDEICTVSGHKLDNLAINSTTAVAAEARVNLALPATAVVEFMAKWLNLYPRTVQKVQISIGFDSL